MLGLENNQMLMMEALKRSASNPERFDAYPIKYVRLGKEVFKEKMLLRLIRIESHQRLANCLEVIFKQKDISVLEVGVNEGKLIKKLLKRRPNSKVYAIEPNSKMITKLREELPKNVQIFNFGLGESDSNATLYITKATRNSSQYKPNPNYQKLMVERDGKPNDVFDVIDEINFQVIRGDDFLASNNISEIDFLSLNTQGSEFSILKGLKKSLKSGKIKSIMLENDLDNRYVGASDDFVEQQVLLKECGFRLFEIIVIRDLYLKKAGMRRLYPFYVHHSVEIERG